MAFIPIYILILGFTIVIDYFAGIWLEETKGKKRKYFLIASLIANIGVLAVFKYYNFLNDNLSVLLNSLGYVNSIPHLGIILPIGLSFHTFQAMSYTIEVYRGHQKAERNFGIYSLYVMFYPQLVAGPIERPQNLIHQFYEKHYFPMKINIDGTKLETSLLLGSAAIILIYLSPYLIWGQDCLIRIGDNLDSNVPWNVLMSRNILEKGWNYDTVSQVMNGIPKVSLGSQLYFGSVLYLFFKPFAAYVINIFLMHFIAFFGMLLLLKKINPNNSKNSLFIIYGTAICFALLDFWPSGGLSVAGLPLILYAFLNIRENKARFPDYLIVLIFPFYSSLVLSGFFILFAFTIWLFLDLVKSKRLNYRGFLMLVVLSGLYLIVEHALALSWFFSDDSVSHRVEFLIHRNSFGKSIQESIQVFLYGMHSHAKVHQFPVILLSIFVSLIIALRKRPTKSRILFTLIITALVLSILSGFYHWVGLAGVKEKYSIINTFDFSRFAWLLPLVFPLLFFYSLQIILKTFPKSIMLITLIFLCQIALEFKRNSNDHSLLEKTISKSDRPNESNYSLTYRQYYSENLFNTIKRSLPLDQRKSHFLCLGIDPGVLQYNGFNTLDSYQANYPLSYKHEFRKIIEKELIKDEQIRANFDTFGSTCYLF
jgi:hypothetical protein